MRSDARKRTADPVAPDALEPILVKAMRRRLGTVEFHPHDSRAKTGTTSMGFLAEFDEYADARVAETLAPFIALATNADRQFGSAQSITRDALWAAIAVARGEQS